MVTISTKIVTTAASLAVAYLAGSAVERGLKTVFNKI